MTTPTSARQVLRSRGAACARRRGRRSWTASPGRPRRGWIRSSGARENLWSRGATAREASGSRPRRARPATPARHRRRARCSERCSRREAAAGGSAGAGGRSSSSRRSARCAWRSSGPGTCWRTSPARTASTGPAPCPGSRPPPAAPSAAPPSASPTTSSSSVRSCLPGRRGRVRGAGGPADHAAPVEPRGTVQQTPARAWDALCPGRAPPASCSAWGSSTLLLLLRVAGVACEPSVWWCAARRVRPCHRRRELLARWTAPGRRLLCCCFFLGSCRCFLCERWINNLPPSCAVLRAVICSIISKIFHVRISWQSR